MTEDGCRLITRFPATELLVAGRQYVRGADLTPTPSADALQSI